MGSHKAWWWSDGRGAGGAQALRGSPPQISLGIAFFLVLWKQRGKCTALSGKRLINAIHGLCFKFWLGVLGN